MEDGFTIRNNHVQYVKLNKGMFLGGILLVFTPTSKVVFGILGIASGFVNWGLLILVGIVVLGVKLNNKFDLSGINPFRSEEDDDL